MMEMFAAVVVIATIYFFVRDTEARLALLGGGLALPMPGSFGIALLSTAVPASSSAVMVVISLGLLG